MNSLFSGFETKCDRRVRATVGVCECVCVFVYRKRTMRQEVTTFLALRKESTKRLSCKRCAQCNMHEQCKSMRLCASEHILLDIS